MPRQPRALDERIPLNPLALSASARSRCDPRSTPFRSAQSDQPVKNCEESVEIDGSTRHASPIHWPTKSSSSRYDCAAFRTSGGAARPIRCQSAHPGKHPT